MPMNVVSLHGLRDQNNLPKTGRATREITFSKIAIRKLVEQSEHEAGVEFRDTGCRGLVLRKGRRDWVFSIKRKINGKVRRATIERWTGQNDIAAVRSDAQRIMLDMKNGTHLPAKAYTVIAQKAEAKNTQLMNLATMTVAEAVDLHARVNPQLRDTTLDSYRYAVTDFQDGKVVNMSEVTSQALRDAYVRVSTGKSPATANLMLRSLSALWKTWATEHPEDEEPQRNPISAVTGKRRGVVKRVAPRDNALRPDERLNWFAEATKRDSVTGNALAFLFLTGLRKNEAMQLRWSEVDLDAMQMQVQGQRMKSGISLIRPITPQMLAIIERQKREHPDRIWVFPGTTGTGPCRDTRKTLKLVNETALPPNRSVTVHDLRRTYLAAAAIAGIPDVASKMLVGHSVSDITEAYQTALRSELGIFAGKVEDELLKAYT